MTFISYLMQSMFIIELYFSFTFFLFVFPRRKYWYFPFALLAIANVAIQISLRFASSSALNPVYVLLIQLANLVLFFMMALLTLDVKPGTALMVLLTCYITHRLEYLTFILICLATSQDLGTNYTTFALPSSALPLTWSLPWPTISWFSVVLGTNLWDVLPLPSWSWLPFWSFPEPLWMSISLMQPGTLSLCSGFRIFSFVLQP
jgi:hypothetical protein